MAAQKVVQIPCPRCAGRGRGNWHPDRGICYRCKGAKIVSINVSKYEAVLRNLRRRYVELRAAVQNGVEGAVEALRACEKDGLRVRAALDAAKGR